MTAKWDECVKNILDKLEVSEERMQNIEMDHLRVMDFEKKFIFFEKKFNQMTKLLDNMAELPKFIER